MPRMKTIDYLHRTAVVALLIFTAYNGVVFANSGFRMISNKQFVGQPETLRDREINDLAAASETASATVRSKTA